jgi:hypothetical protein
VTLREHPPDIGAKGKSVGQYLKDDVSLRRPVAAVSKRRQAQRTSGAVSKVELLYSEFDVLSASFSLASPDCSRPANSFASGGSFDRTFPGPARRSSGDWEVMLATDCIAGRNHGSRRNDWRFIRELLSLR